MVDSIATTRWRYTPFVAIGVLFSILTPVLMGLTPGADYNADAVGLRIQVLSVTMFIALLVTILFESGVRPARHRQPGSDAIRAATLWRLMALFAIFPLFAVSFNRIKSILVLWAPWHIDQALISLDCAAGVCPHQLILPWLSLPGVFDAAGVFYNLAWPTFYGLGVPAYAMMMANDQARAARMLTTNLIVWFAFGVVGATLAYSVGPVLVGKTLDTLRYNYLVADLKIAHANSVLPVSLYDAIHMLREGYQTGERQSPAMGISAMPSMHMAMSMLVWCYARTMANRYRILTTLGVAVTFIVGVGVGWHYVSDMIVSMAITGGLWAFMGRFRRFQPQSCPESGSAR